MEKEKLGNKVSSPTIQGCPMNYHTLIQWTLLCLMREKQQYCKMRRLSYNSVFLEDFYFGKYMQNKETHNIIKEAIFV